MYENVLCVIPARGGSKGIPNKNMQRLSGAPLIVFSIRQAIDAGIPEENIVVSSDSEEILSLSRSWHVSTRQRPSEICQDNSSTESALIDAVDTCGKDVDTLVLLQPTSPIRFRGRIEQSLDMYFSGDYDSLLTTTKLYDFFWIDHSEKPVNPAGPECGVSWVSTYHPSNRPRRQDLRKQDYRYFDNGNIYISEIKTLKERKCRIGHKVCVMPITELEGMQIDTPEDLRIFKTLLSSTGLLLISVDSLEKPDEKLQSGG